MLHHVFVSYSRRDSGWVQALIEELARRRVPFWIDREGIPFSVPWREEVEDAVQACDLFLVCDSDHWRTSRACEEEATFALTFGKARHEVPVGRDVGAAAEQAARQWAAAVRRHGTATELAVKAREWHASGRTGKGLASWRLRRQFDALRKERQPSSVERAYLAASRRRNRRRAAVSVLLTFLLLVTYLSFQVAPGVEDEVNRRLADQAARYSAARDAITLIRDDPYRGLSLAARLGDNESAADADILEEALAVDVPDDAFALPAAGRHFADPTVGSRVRVTARDGTTWGRDADDRERRSASRLSGEAATPATEDSTDPSVSLVWHTGSARVRVLRHNKPWRTLDLTSDARAARLSPDARWAAVATDAGVALVDLARGTVRDLLRGAPAPLTDLAWADGNDRIWGLTGRSVVSWDIADGDLLLDRPDEWFQDVLPASDDGRLWVTSRNGTLRLLERSSGTVVRTLKVDGILNYAAVDDDGKNAAVVDADHSRVRIVSLASGRANPLKIPFGCTPVRPVYSHDGHTLYLPCQEADVLVVDVGSRKQTGTIRVPGAGATAVALAGDGLLLGAAGGNVYSADARTGSSPRLLHTVGCGPKILDIATAPGSRILPVGVGTGLVGCTETAHSDGDGGYVWNKFIDSPSDSVLALAAAYDPTGKALAIGFSDGTVVLHPSANVLPRQVLAHLTGGVRSMLTLPAAGSAGTKSDLYVATRAGTLVRIAWCPSCLSNKAMARVAGQRLRRAESLGLYEPPPASPAPTATTRWST